jgi:Protein of unknown function (DUF2721).
MVSMNINYTVAALMFPAIPLLMSVYNNRFHTLSALIRKIHDELFLKNIFLLNGKNNFQIYMEELKLQNTL